MKKITAGDNQKKAPKGFVYLVYGVETYSGWDTLAVTTSRKMARLAIATDKTVRRVSKVFAFEGYKIQRFQLDTVVFHSGFTKKVRSL
jgi:hypothetical protein